jgi:hypothetical protein
MNPITLRRIAIIGAVLTVLVAIDGIYMLVSHYNGNETQNYHLPDGATVLIAAGLLLVLTIVAFVLSNRPQLNAVPVETAVVEPGERSVIEPGETSTETIASEPVETVVSEPGITTEPRVVNEPTQSEVQG